MKSLYKTVSFFLALSVALFCLTGCKKTNDIQTGKRTIEDMNGNTIQLPDKVESYGILYASAVSMCGILDEGLSKAVLCCQLYADWTSELFPQLASHAVMVDKKSVTAEEIIESGAQVVFWSSSSHQELISSLEKIGISCVNVAVKTASDISRAMQIIADVLNTDYAHNNVNQYCEKTLQYSSLIEKTVATIPESEKKSVLIIGSINEKTGIPSMVYQPFWAEDCGLKTLFTNDNNGTITMEQIAEYNPDIIVLDETINLPLDYFQKNNLWSNLKAIENNNIIKAPIIFDTWAKPVAETPLQFLFAVNQIYPEYIEMDLVGEIISFYSVFYKHIMDKQTVEKYLNFKLN